MEHSYTETALDTKPRMPWVVQQLSERVPLEISYRKSLRRSFKGFLTEGQTDLKGGKKEKSTQHEQYLFNIRYLWCPRFILQISEDDISVKDMQLKKLKWFHLTFWQNS